MIRENQTAVVARNETWRGRVTTEPYEAGWATEAVVFVRALAIGGTPPSAGAGPAGRARIQLSADGMRWVDEGTVFDLPSSTECDACVRIGRFGNWLRVAADLSAGVEMKALVTLHLK